MTGNLNIKPDNFDLVSPHKGFNVLVVDDEELIVEMLSYEVMDMGHNVLKAYNGQEALEILARKHQDIDVILIDKMMPVMNGIDAVIKIKENPLYNNIAVVMITGNGTKEDLKVGIEAGIFYYLSKPFEDDVLRSVISAALRKADQDKTLSKVLKKHFTGFDLFESATFNFSNIDEAKNLSAFVANFFAEPGRVLPGLGQLMQNAIEHGNLGIGYDEKGRLLEEDAFDDEVKVRLQSEEYKDKKALITVAKKDDGIYVVIEDMGSGFNWQKYLEIDPTRAGSSHGRGIAQAKALSFDKLTYNEAGNKAIAFVKNGSGINW